MKIVDVRQLAFPDVLLLSVEKFRDDRGYFMEHYRHSDLVAAVPSLVATPFVQANGSFSHRGTVRGLHFQWSPPMGKLVRTVVGHMIDMVLDVRPDSPTFGSALAIDMPAREAIAELIWIPPGFAHGNAFLEETYIEYLCTGEYSAEGEAAISPMADDIDWSQSDPSATRIVHDVLGGQPVLSPRDRAAPGVAAWRRDPRATALLHATHFVTRSLAGQNHASS